MSKKLNYDDIDRIYYKYFDYKKNRSKEFLMLKTSLDIEDFEKIIKVFKKNKVLDWEKEYSAYYENNNTWLLEVSDRSSNVFISKGNYMDEVHTKVFDILKKYNDDYDYEEIEEVKVVHDNSRPEYIDLIYKEFED